MGRSVRWFVCWVCRSVVRWLAGSSRSASRQSVGRCVGAPSPVFGPFVFHPLLWCFLLACPSSRVFLFFSQGVVESPSQHGEKGPRQPSVPVGRCGLLSATRSRVPVHWARCVTHADLVTIESTVARLSRSVRGWIACATHGTSGFRCCVATINFPHRSRNVKRIYGDFSPRWKRQ